MALPIREQVAVAFADRVETFFASKSIAFSRARRTTDGKSFKQPEVTMFAPIDSDVTVEYKRTSATIEVALEYRDTLEDLALIEQQASEMLAELITASMKASDINLGGLARSISYAGAEIEYPQTGSLTVGVTAIIAIRYSFKSDDPYTQ